MNTTDPIRVLIVDDESLARDTISLLLEDEPRFDVIGECEDGNEAVAAIREKQPDLVFLDIQMPGKNGFEVVEAIGAEAMPAVIFATAYDEYALRAFDLHALDYLLKPYDDERFERALNRAVKQIEQQKMGKMGNQLMKLVSGWRASQEPAVAPTPAVAIETPYLERIMVKTRDALFFVQVDDIDWIEAAGDYVMLHVGTQTHLVRDSMTRMEKKLPPRSFVRIHRSTIINLSRVKQFKPYFHGDYIVYLNDGTELRLSRRYWSRVERIIG